MIVTRTDFIKKTIQAGLLALLALLLLILGGRVVTGTDCSNCPGKGVCKGEKDCRNYRMNAE
ncbi:MAG: hypothetical protein A2Y87_01890 [Bacteroidetes bacterium RBG_13_46_8]|nr:MAG: hypothetical protein A2Y87_01890 [Bacteroidetes bacterium RBG_13_46_8]